MNNKVLKYEITKCCAYCEKATVTEDEDAVSCSKKGTVDAGYCCHSFTYDLLKRKPSLTLMPEALDPTVLQF